MEGNSTEGRSGGARRAWPLFVGLPLVVLLAVGAVLFAGGGEEGSSPSGGQAGQPTGGSGGEGQAASLGHPALGREDAPVVMIEYGDYG